MRETHIKHGFKIAINEKTGWVDCQPWKTLNDFLSDCKRAGITLTYKE